MSNMVFLKPSRVLSYLVALCLACAGGNVARALLAYEPFQYGDVAIPSAGQYAVGNEDAGTNLLGGQDPVIGPTAFYTGPWIQTGGDSQVVKAVPSIVLSKFSRWHWWYSKETVQLDCCTFGRTGREIAGGLGGGRDAKTYYESFLINFGAQGTDDPTQFGKRGHELWNGYDPASLAHRQSVGH